MFQGIFKNYLILLSLLFVLFYYFKKNKFNDINFVLFFLVLNIIFINFAYLLTDLPIEFAIKSGGMDRLMFETSGYYILFIIIFLNKFNKST